MAIKNVVIAMVPVAKIKTAKYNPRKDLQPGDPEYEKLKASLHEFGVVDPLVWNKKTGNLVGGHQRLKVLLEDEPALEAVQASIVNLPLAKEKALNLALNKIAGEWDMPKLKDLLQELDTGEFDMLITGFDEMEIENLISQLPQRPDMQTLIDQFAPPATGQTKADRNWFYVEYYGKDKEFERVMLTLKAQGALLTEHQIDPAKFAELVNVPAEAK